MHPRLRELLRVGRCGPVARALALCAVRLPVPGSHLVAFGLLGKPRRGPIEVEVERDGIRWALDLRDDAHRVMYLDLYERDLRRRVLDLLPRGGTFVDVGANVGFWSVPAARQSGSAGRVLAFEPNPWAVRLLRRNVAANAGADVAPVTVAAVAVGADSGALRLYAASLEEFASQVTAHPVDAAGEFIDVPVVALDAEVEGLVDVLKLDVEGHEFAVLDGALSLLTRPDRPHHVVIEMQDALLVRAGHSAEALAQRLEGFGYAAVDGDGAMGRGPVARPLPSGFYETVVWRRQ